jgi:hypothetical protein
MVEWLQIPVTVIGGAGMKARQGRHHDSLSQMDTSIAIKKLTAGKATVSVALPAVQGQLRTAIDYFGSLAEPSANGNSTALRPLSPCSMVTVALW